MEGAEWMVIEQKSISLQEPAARSLLEGLRQHLAVANQPDDGNYLVLRVSDGATVGGDHDPEAVATAIVRVLGQADIARHLRSKELGGELVNAFRGAIRLQELRSAGAALRQYLDADVADEQIYQEWCEQHTWAFGNAYVMRDKVRNISAGDRLDLLLPTVIAGYRDIVELKRPDMKVILWDEVHGNWYWSRETTRAIGQSHRYLDVLHEEAGKGLRDHPEIVAYHPRATVVIGRSKGWEQERLRALHGLNRRLSGITVMTYDQLLAQGERLVEVLGAEVDRADEEPLETWEGDDIPF